MHAFRSSVVLLALAFGFVLAGCEPPNSSGPDAVRSAAGLERDREAVIEAHQALVSAYEAADVEAFVGVLEPSAELLIFHPKVEDRFDGVEDVRRQISRMFARLGGAEWSDHHAIVSVEGDVAWLTAQVLVESPNVDPAFVGRSTEIYVRRSNGWKLIHGHWSTMPES